MKIEAPRGTFDVLPAEQSARDAIEAAVESAAARYAYGRIITPTFEDTDLFARTAGQGSDLVTKEMYTFEDRAGRSLTLRPEATASVARAYIEHGLHREAQPVKTFYIGPMYRYASPQKGRFREFWQFGFEAMGSADAALDAELIQLFAELLDTLGVEGVRLELNSIGDRQCRPQYLEQLRTFLAQHEDELDQDARQKAATSPLRVFDTKNPTLQRLLGNAPTIGESLCEACREHYEQVRRFLDALEVSYVVEPTLVRGLDYYTRTVWEFTNDRLEAAQSTICAGGRYDYLIEEIGGPPTPGVGWAAGIERLVLSMEEATDHPGIDVFLAFADSERRNDLLPALARLRGQGLRCDTDYAGRSIKGQLTHGRRLGARMVVVAASDTLTVRRPGKKDIEVEHLDDVVDLL